MPRRQSKPHSECHSITNSNYAITNHAHNALVQIWFDVSRRDKMIMNLSSTSEVGKRQNPASGGRFFSVILSQKAHLSHLPTLSFASVAHEESHSFRLSAEMRWFKVLNHSDRCLGGFWQRPLNAICTLRASKPASRQTSRKSAEGKTPIQRSTPWRFSSFRGWELQRSLRATMTTDCQRSLDAFGSFNTNPPNVMD